MYERILVATDLSPLGTAVTVASTLGATTRSLELLTVSPSRTFCDVARVGLERIAARNGWPPAACTVLVGADVAETILRHVERRLRALLVIGSSGPPWTTPSGRITRSILSATRHPVLIIGPDVDVDFRPQPSTLVVAVDDPEPDPAVTDAIGTWVPTFGARRILLVHARDDLDDTPTCLETWAETSKAAALDVEVGVVRARDHAAGLAAFASGGGNSVVVTTSRHYTDDRRALTSTTRDLIRHGRSPVLVVPAREPLEQATLHTRQASGELRQVKAALRSGGPR